MQIEDDCAKLYFCVRYPENRGLVQGLLVMMMEEPGKSFSRQKKELLVRAEGDVGGNFAIVISPQGL